MNERFLSRGKRKDNGNWETGFLVITRYDCSDEQYFITDKMTGWHTPVIPETVGQCTGSKDKNGKLIFEGDIVKITDRNVCFETMAVIEFGNPNGLYNWGWQLKPLENKPFAIEILHWVDMEDSGAFIEVIGNIHDNPELLQRSDEE